MKQHRGQIWLNLLCLVALVAVGTALILMNRPAAQPEPQPTPTAAPQPTAGSAPEWHRYSAVFDNTFDTIVSLIGYAEKQETFENAFARVEGIFTEYHRLFDAYHTYDGMENLCSLNQKAGQAPVAVDQKLFDFIQWCLEQEQTYGTQQVNIAMGSVLQLWHSAREAGIANPADAALPDMAALQAAAQHQDIASVILDPENRTVYYADPQLQLDFGAVAKGYTAQVAANALAASDMPSFILNAGGNVCAGHPKADTGALWGIGIQDPDGGVTGNDLFDTLYAADRAVVTSGDYQRYYVVNGTRYAHLISPLSLMPATQFRAVTIVAEDSALCDFLSTYLFIADYETGRALVDSLPDTEALWIFPDRSVQFTDGMKQYMKSEGAVSK